MRFLTLFILFITACTAVNDADGDLFPSVVDCDDTNVAIYPGATELCDGVDNDCDDEVDESDAVDAPTWYADVDGDGFGDVRVRTRSCVAPEGAVDNDTDCDDTNAAAYPGAAEVCDGIDNGCNGTVDEGATDAPTWYIDADGDGYGHPSGVEVACRPPTGFVEGYRDCDDENHQVNPGQYEICNEVDDDCDGTADEDAVDASLWYEDADEDGLGDPSTAMRACTAPEGWVGNPCGQGVWELPGE